MNHAKMLKLGTKNAIITFSLAKIQKVAAVAADAAQWRNKEKCCAIILDTQSGSAEANCPQQCTHAAKV